MRKYIIHITLLFACTLSAQITSLRSSLKTNDVVFDINTDKLYVTIPSSNGDNGNSLGIINPFSNTLENTIFIGDEPTVMALSLDNQYIYIGFDDSPVVKRFNLSTQLVDMEFELGSNQNGDVYFAHDIEVLPDNPNSIAIVRKTYSEISGRSFAGVGIYDDGIMRPTEYYTFIGPTNIEFKNSTQLIGYVDNTDITTSILNIDSSGVTLHSEYSQMPNSAEMFATPMDFIFRNNKAYFTNGRVVDFSSTPYISGILNSQTSSALAYDEVNNLLCYAYTSSATTWLDGILSNVYLKRFNPTTYELYDSVQVQAYGFVDKLVTCGDGCIAFSTDLLLNGYKSFNILRNVPLNTDSIHISNPSILIHPNPASNLLYIDVPDDIVIRNIDILNVDGKIMQTTYNKNVLNIEHLPQGFYLIKIADLNGNFYTEKIIKR